MKTAQPTDCILY